MYPLRVEQVKTLLNKEALGKQVELVVSAKAPGASPKSRNPPKEQDLDRCAITVQHERTRDELEDSRLRIDMITTQATKLRQEMEDYRRQIKDTKQDLAKRRHDIRTAATNVAAFQAQYPSALKHATKKTLRLQEGQYPDLVARRINLCRGTAYWARLQRTRRPWSGQGDNNKSFEYSIGGHVIPDLRALNNLERNYDPAMFPATLTAVLTDICRLLHIVCRYLQIRLPAEITVPHRNWPLPTIFSPSSSYSGHPATFPTTTTSTRQSRSEPDLQRATGRPRPLFLKRPLEDLMRDDSAGYALFIEGVTLLAWDVAWLCRTQGLPIASSRWEDVCPIGHNLWSLLVDVPRRGDAAAPDLQARLPSAHSAPVEANKSGSASASASAIATSSRAPALGQYSHGSLTNFLRPGAFPALESGEETTNPTSISTSTTARGWVFASPVKIQHELKSFLLNEYVGLGWEFADAGEGSGLLHPDGEADMDGQRDENGKGKAQAQAQAQKGTSGWTKLKTRGSEM